MKTAKHSRRAFLGQTAAGPVVASLRMAFDPKSGQVVEQLRSSFFLKDSDCRDTRSLLKG